MPHHDAKQGAGFASLQGVWQGEVQIADDFDELPADLADALGMRGDETEPEGLSAKGFRNVDASPCDPVAQWPQEAIQDALERGGRFHWRRLVAAIREEPWGPAARRVEEVLTYSRPYGVAKAMERVLAAAREAAEKSERETVAREVKWLIEASGLTGAGFASRIGTSTSRLSTYATGKVTPSAALLVRMRSVANAKSEQAGPAHETEGERAGRTLLSMAPPPGPEPDWEDQS